ncbi:MAG: peptidylprolyl isomerase [Rhodospirillales bacterium]|nr:peptidylprolyl isomerase [Rhodospirillales bacterium]
MVRQFVFGFLVFLLAAMPTVPHAQETQEIAAIVNDQVISVYDLNMRLTLVMLFSGLNPTAETRQRLAPQVLRTLIDEELKRQEAKRIGIDITDKEIAQIMRRMEKTSNLSKGELKDYLENRKVAISILVNQIRADLSWRQLVNGRYGAGVIISDQEIEENLAKIKSNEGKPEFRVSEIFLPVDKPENDAQIAALANRLIEQARSGTNFAALARNFSKNQSAEKGGDLGWNRIGQLNPELDKALAQLQVGQLSPPIRTPDGYYILALKDQRTAKKFGQPDPGAATVNLQQLYIPVAKNANPSVVDGAMNQARQIGQQAKNCKELDQTAKKLGSPLSGNLGDVKIDALGKQQRGMIETLAPLQASQPLRTPDGVLLLMVCRRDEIKTPQLSIQDQRDRISSGLRNERLSILARQYIRDLRRQAFMEIRL